MKTALSKLMRNEKGQALPIVLVLLLLGSLFTAPLLGYMGTGLIAGQVHEERMKELYAADAGVEDGLWYLTSGNLTVSENATEILTPFTINDALVNVTIYGIHKGNASETYKITSVATSAGGSSNTTIEAYVLLLPLFFTNAATSSYSVTLTSQGGNQPVVNGPIIDDYDENQWPFGQSLSVFYLGQIDQASDNWTSDTLDIQGTPIIGPLYRDGDLKIINLGSAGDNATLGGTVFVTGNLNIGKTNQDFTLNLDYNTIYVLGDISIGGKTTITGSGVIIAQGDIDFKPNMDTSPGDFVFVMSEDGEVNFQPSGDFYGAVAGKISIELQPGNILSLTDPPVDTDGNIMLNFPMESVESAVKIYTWDINLQ